MTHDETRDNTTAIENQIIEADKRAREESAPYPPAYPFPVFGGEPAEEEYIDEFAENGFDPTAGRVILSTFSCPAYSTIHFYGG